jgi:hypothetical protein
VEKRKHQHQRVHRQDECWKEGKDLAAIKDKLWKKGSKL